MSPHKILIASVLKPANDVRMARKIGTSLAKIKGTQVHVAGFAAKDATLPGLTLHHLFNFKRISTGRFFANYTLLKLLFKLKPQLLIIATHELLPAALLYKLVSGCRFVYDVQENYLRNIVYTSAFPILLRWPLALLVRLVEKFSARFIDLFLLAERVYWQELLFVRRKAVVIENKYLPNQPNLNRSTPVGIPPSGLVNLLYSGTIAANYGIFEAISLIDLLHKVNERYQLTIIGYAPQADLLLEVKNKIAGKPYIQLIGGGELVPHEQIITAIRKAHIGLLPYQPNRSTDGRIPTKLFEYLAGGLVLVVQQNPVWEAEVKKWDAGLMVDFSKIQPEEIQRKLSASTFYNNGPVTGIFWAEEEEKLIQAVKNQLNETNTK